MTQTVTETPQPTTEQSLHSIALSMIEIHKETKKIRQFARDTLRFTRQEARQTVYTPAPRKRGPFDWLRSLLPA